MPSKKIIFFLVSISLFPNKATPYWGFFAHRKVNHHAVYLLPEPLLSFALKHHEYISEHAIDPDKRRHAVKGEAECHFIDLDRYSWTHENIDSVLPKNWMQAVAKYGEDTLREHGIAPWNLKKQYYRLVSAFREKNLERLPKLMADFGHYLGDIHVPLHTTENYNGQLTQQTGIHGLWETNIPELFYPEYNKLFGPIQYVQDIDSLIWSVILGSHELTKKVFSAELETQREMPLKRSFVNRKSVINYRYSKSYTQHYSDKLGVMVEQQWRLSVFHLACLWYSAWVDAGQPNLE